MTLLDIFPYRPFLKAANNTDGSIEPVTAILHHFENPHLRSCACHCGDALTQHSHCESSYDDEVPMRFVEDLEEVGSVPSAGGSGFIMTGVVL